MILYIAIVVVLCCSLNLLGNAASYTKQHMRAKFEEDFHNRCDKHPFVQQFYNRLENPNDRFIVFTYHEKGLRNGGIGDRFGGLTTAVALSLRFNRTLLIKASNGFHQSFRPYHPTDVHSESPKYLWQNWANWTNYANYQTSHLEEYDEIEEIDHIMEDCVSNMEEGFTPEQTHRCAMDDGDVPQPVIRFNSNRAYLCRWNNHPEYKAFKEFKRVLLGPDFNPSTSSRGVVSGSTASKSAYLNANGTDPSADLFEVAGCMMRLALWPTEALWDSVDKLYAQYEHTLVPNQSADESSLRIGTGADPSADSDSSGSVDDDNSSSGGKKKKKSKKSKKKKSKKSKKSKKRKTQEADEDTASDESDPTAAVSNLSTNTSVSVLQHPVYQIGMHLRCGDKHSYFNLKLHTDGYDRFACIVEQPNIEGKESSTAHEKSIYLNAGNPITIGQCGRAVYEEYVAAEAKAQRKRARLLKQQIKGEWRCCLLCQVWFTFLDALSIHMYRCWRLRCGLHGWYHSPGSHHLA